MLSTVLSVILAIIGVILCIVVLLQPNRAAGLGAVNASQRQFYGRHSCENNKNSRSSFYDNSSCSLLYIIIIMPALTPAFILFKNHILGKP